MGKTVASALAVIAGLALVGALPANAQDAGSGPIDPGTGMRLPLLPGERLVPFKNGCNVVMDAYDNPALDKYYGESLWLGACRFGLADGPGYYISESTNVPRKAIQVRYRFGQGPLSARAIRDAEVLAWKPGSVFTTSGSINVTSTIKRNEYMKDMPSLLDNTSTYAVNIVAADREKDDAREVTKTLWIRRENCPWLLFSDTMAKKLSTISMDAPLTPAQVRLLTPFCQAAFDRAKAEGRLNGDPMTWNNPFEKNTYGYFFVVLNERGLSVNQGDRNQYVYQQIPASNRYSDVTLCPALTSLASCEPVWKALQAPYRARLEEVRAKLEQQARAADADRERRFAPLVAAWREKVGAQAAAYSAQLRSERQAAELARAAQAAAAKAASGAAQPAKAPPAHSASRRRRGQ